MFTNSQVFQTTLDRFADSDSPLLRAGSKSVIVSQLLTLIVGLVIGLVSLNQLQLLRAYSVLWIFSVIAMTMFLTQWLYLGFKYLKTLGMGLALFLLLSYIYLTNAIGTTASLEGFPLAVRNLNILSLFENLLSGFFVREPIALWQIFLIILGLAAGITLGLFEKPAAIEET